MSARIEVKGVPATVTDLVWQCTDDNLLGYLETTLPVGGFGGEVPNPDLAAAERAAKMLGGKVIASDPTEDEDGAVY